MNNELECKPDSVSIIQEIQQQCDLIIHTLDRIIADVDSMIESTRKWNREMDAQKVIKKEDDKSIRLLIALIIIESVKLVLAMRLAL